MCSVHTYFADMDALSKGLLAYVDLSVLNAAYQLGYSLVSFPKTLDEQITLTFFEVVCELT